MNRNRQTQRRQTHEQKPVQTDLIRDMELEALTLSNERNQLSEKALKIKTEALMGVEAEWTTFQSKSLSNQTKRNAAADDRLALNEEYPILVNDIMEIDAVLKEMDINIRFEKRKFTRETAHIDDLHDINASLKSLSRDVNIIVMTKSHPIIQLEADTSKRVFHL